jgi:murein DD-endopeptidase MepM/ murein hydrolase activator NlpD
MIRRAVHISLAAGLLLLPLHALAQDTTTISGTGGAFDLQQQIDVNNAQIAQLDQEIAQYQAQLDDTTAQKDTLQNTINQLTLQQKQLNAKISVTKSQISTTQLQITQLAHGIAGAQSTIDDERAGLAQSLRSLNQAEGIPLATTLLSADTLAEAWHDADAIASLQGAVHDDVQALSQQKQTLTDTKTQAEQKKAQLVRQQTTLTTQQGSLNATKKAQSDLLAQTKNQEANYQAIISQKQAAKASFEAALLDLNAQFQQTVDPSQIPTAGKGILQWPLDKVRITQYFGNTAFAQSGAYNGKGHNGIDLAASIGTPVKAALTGVVIGTGNTDAIRGCYSFGKWVMVRHNNGLSTMYAHFSQISVSEGQSVATGQLLGYSGETGYATGPHLHFGVYVTAVTKIVKLGEATNSKTPCTNAVMPVPPLSGYLNPLNYLPAL